MSTFGYWLSDNRDQVNFFMVKILGTILTALAIIGYLDSVSKLDDHLTIHHLVVAFILLMITLLGYSVYVYTMMTDIAGDATLLNYLYLVFAITNQVRTSLLFYMAVFETISPKQDNFYKTLGTDCTFFVIIWNVFAALSIAFTTLLKNKSPKFYMDLSQKNPKVVMITFGMNLLLTIMTFLSGFQFKHFEDKRNHYEKVFFPFSLVIFCILSKVTVDEYGIVKRVKKRLGKMLRKSNSVTPEIDGGMLENGTGLDSIGEPNQVCAYIYIYRHFWLRQGALEEAISCVRACVCVSLSSKEHCK